MPRGSGYRQPGNWAALRAKVLRDYEHRCYSPHPNVCIGDAMTVDHVVPVAEGGTHALTNLAAICKPCHDAKTEAERLRGIARAKPRGSRKRLPERHPNAPRG